MFIQLRSEEPTYHLHEVPQRYRAAPGARTLFANLLIAKAADVASILLLSFFTSFVSILRSAPHEGN